MPPTSVDEEPRPEPAGTSTRVLMRRLSGLPAVELRTTWFVDSFEEVEMRVVFEAGCGGVVGGLVKIGRFEFDAACGEGFERGVGIIVEVALRIAPPNSSQ